VNSLLSRISAPWRRELEWPQLGSDRGEVISTREKLVDHAANTLNIQVSELLLNLLVVDEWDALPVDLEVAPLAHEPLDGCDGWVAEGDVRLDELEHADGGLVHFDQNRVVDLTQAKQSKDFTDFRRQTVDTANSDHKEDFRFWFKEESSADFGFISLLL